MLSIIFSIYLAITIIICFYRIRIGISMYLFYSILVPYINFFSFGQNLFSLAILAALLFNYKLKSLIYKPLKPFFFLFLAQFILIPFHDKVPLAFQLNEFRSNFMSTLLLPFAMINVMKKDSKALPLFNITLIIAIIIASVYSLILTSMPGLNPYLMVIMPLSGTEFDELYALAEESGRMFGRISGVFPHPMTNGLFLSLALIFLIAFIDTRQLLKHKLHILLSMLVIASILFIGVRSPIGAIAGAFITFLLLKRRLKILIYVGTVLLLFTIILQHIPGMENYINSIFDPSSESVSGSSVKMRLDQLEGCFREIKNNYFFGNGFSWTTYYQKNHGDHPVMLAFESLILVVLCNNGIMGILIWGIFIKMYWNLIFLSFAKDYAVVMITLLITYLAYSIITGEYGYIKYFLIFYSMMWFYGKDIYLKRLGFISYIIKKEENTPKDYN